MTCYLKHRLRALLQLLSAMPITLSSTLGDVDAYKM